MTATQHFSDDYAEARERFLDAARTVGAVTESLRNPAAGPGGGALCTDLARLGPPDAKNLLVMISGTHGVEGFVGSAIQSGLLVEGLASRLPPGLGVIMVHALNPYGFAHLRRFNEDNVDLNRNFVDHGAPYPDNPGYEVLADVIAPDTLSPWSDARTRLRLLWYRLTRGQLALREAVSRGQYTHPEGLFFGGRAETWSNRTLRELARRHLAPAERIVVIDVHTGLGPYGYGEIILNEAEDSPACRRAREWWGDRVKTTASGRSVSVHLQGTLKLALTGAAPAAEVTAVGLEFGTVPPMEVFLALRAENWLHHRGGPEHPDALRIRARLLRAFYPESDAWKVKVWEQGRAVVERALEHLR